MLLCDWHSFSSDLEDLFNSIINKKVISTPFPILSLTDNPELQLKSANNFSDYYSFKNYLFLIKFLIAMIIENSNWLLFI